MCSCTVVSGMVRLLVVVGCGPGWPDDIWLLEGKSPRRRSVLQRSTDLLWVLERLLAGVGVLAVVAHPRPVSEVDAGLNGFEDRPERTVHLLLVTVVPLHLY